MYWEGVQIVDRVCRAFFANLVSLMDGLSSASISTLLLSTRFSGLAHFPKSPILLSADPTANLILQKYLTPAIPLLTPTFSPKIIQVPSLNTLPCLWRHCQINSATGRIAYLSVALARCAVDREMRAWRRVATWGSLCGVLGVWYDGGGRVQVEYLHFAEGLVFYLS